jgi:two-component system OmpR family response regulator
MRTAPSERPGEALTRFELLERVWDDAYEHRSNVIDVAMGHLRDKVDRPFAAASIETVRGVGYRLRT